MSRLNLTLDPDTEAQLLKTARKLKLPRATLARTLLREALASRERTERRRKIAKDYAAGRQDAEELLLDLEASQPGWTDAYED